MNYLFGSIAYRRMIPAGMDTIKDRINNKWLSYGKQVIK
jgi:hypothetical protein